MYTKYNYLLDIYYISKKRQNIFNMSHYSQKKTNEIPLFIQGDLLRIIITVSLLHLSSDMKIENIRGINRKRKRSSGLVKNYI